MTDESEYRPIEKAAIAMYDFINTEMSWCWFRDDMLLDSASGKNGQKLSEFLDHLEAEYPEDIGILKDGAGGFFDG